MLQNYHSKILRVVGTLVVLTTLCYTDKITNSFRKVKIAVVDTGADVNNIRISDNLILPDGTKADKDCWGVDARFVENGKSSDRTNPFSCQADDLSGHGSHVISTILGINPFAEIISIKYEEGSSLIYYNSYRKALYIAATSDADIINLSLTGYNYNKEERDILEFASSLGKIIVVAAGNKNTNQKMYPAGYSDEISGLFAVMSTDRQGKKLKSSNYGSHVNARALGVISAYDNNGNIKTKRGTSMAAAAVSGMISLMIVEDNFTYMPDVGYFVNKAKGRQDIVSRNLGFNVGRSPSSLK
jgi:subtilisin family serine protease